VSDYHTFHLPSHRLIEELMRALLSFICLLSFTVEEATAVSPQETEFFETKIRPVLVQHCYQCHSTDARKLRGNLLLDSQAGILKGGVVRVRA
jgi:mono/diheme cytochrome c family protein